MTDRANALFAAFHQDHAVLGRDFHRLGECLRAADEAGARKLAAQIDQEAGAHIRFEEADFYPALKAFLDADEVAAMYREHAEGRALVAQVLALPDGALADETCRRDLLEKQDAMASHIADCGTLFGAVGGLSEAAQADLLDRLQAWRNMAPRWLDQPAPGP